MPMIFAHMGVLVSCAMQHFVVRVYVYTQTTVDGESQLFWWWESLNTPIGAPCQEENGADSWISIINLRYGLKLAMWDQSKFGPGVH